jgi:hypothetical protein
MKVLHYSIIALSIHDSENKPVQWFAFMV